MKTSRLSILLTAAALGLSIVSSAGAAVPGTLHYKVRLKSESFGDAGIRELWLKAGNMRCDMRSGQMPITVIKNSQGTFLLNCFNKVAGKYPDGSTRGNPAMLIPGPNCSPKAFLQSVKAVKLAMEKVEKQNCQVYSYTEPVTKRQCKLWVNVKSGKPVKLWMNGKHKVMDTMVATYVSFDEGARVADSLFELPKGYTIRPMPKPQTGSKLTIRQLNSMKPGI